MLPAEFERMARLEDVYWWFLARRALTRRLLIRAGLPPGSTVLDAGCGTGGTFAALRDRFRVIGLDRSPVALEFSRKRGMTRLVAGDIQRIPLRPASTDAAVACDVLEHVPDDAHAIAELWRVVRPGGVLVITVPALPWLWSEHDEALGHLRRYTKPQLRRLLIRAGWRIELLAYTVSALLPVITVFRWWRRLRRRPGQPRTDLVELPRPINSLLTWLTTAEGWLLSYGIPLPPGASLVALARKMQD